MAALVGGGFGTRAMTAQFFGMMFGIFLWWAGALETLVREIATFDTDALVASSEVKIPPKREVLRPSDGHGVTGRAPFGRLDHTELHLTPQSA
jgi:hypothetical protein